MCDGTQSTSPFQSRTVTTTERVQILQMPINLTDEQVAPARLLALTPHGNPSQSVSSTVTTMAAEGVPLISGVTAGGAPLFQGILTCPESRQTTTIITTTTTTYRMVEISDSDSMSDDFELVDQSSLTVDIPLVTTARSPSPQYMIVGKTESEAPLSPVMRTRMNIELEIPPSYMERASELDEKPIAESVSVYHSGISEEADSTLSTTDLQSPEMYTHEDITSASEKDYGINIRSGSDMKTISTSSDEDVVLVESDMVLMTTSGSSINEDKYEITKGEESCSDPGSQTKTNEEIQRAARRDVARTLGEKIDDLFRRDSAHLDYPFTETYKGALHSAARTVDIRGEPLTQHVTVYHSGRSDEPTVKPEPEHVDIADTARAFGEKITGLFRRGTAHLDYPVSETYEGPLDSTRRTDDI
ncbi:unnamed protein product, partial [Heligmosomoides polygyrus]|uniref:RIIa domain-containing protein n=1 Tax=Heligmosomoides polygyrus TaxID=6339 RepID=A0A183F6S0_HELPZ